MVDCGNSCSRIWGWPAIASRSGNFPAKGLWGKLKGVGVWGGRIGKRR